MPKPPSIPCVSRRGFIRGATAALTGLALGAEAKGSQIAEEPSIIPPEDYRIKFGRVKQSVMAWCFKPIPEAELIEACRKLGLADAEEGDRELVQQLLDLMAKHQADFTNTFLVLTFQAFSTGTLYQTDDFARWEERWQERLARSGQSAASVQELMKRSNPAVIPRNHRVEEALRPAVQKADYGPVRTLVKVLQDPFAHSPEQREYATPPEPSGLPYRTFCGT